MEFSDVVALKIKELMKEKDISIYKLETLTGVYSSTITLFLNRKTKTIRLENLLYICEALGTNLSKFFADERFNEAEAQNWLKKKQRKVIELNFYYFSLFFIKFFLYNIVLLFHSLKAIIYSLISTFFFGIKSLHFHIDSQK